MCTDKNRGRTRRDASCWRFHIFNLAVGGFFPGLPTTPKYPEVVTADDPNFQQITALPADGTPVKMYVDWVRVWGMNEEL